MHFFFFPWGLINCSPLHLGLFLECRSPHNTYASTTNGNINTDGPDVTVVEHAKNFGVSGGVKAILIQ